MPKSPVFVNFTSSPKLNIPESSSGSISNSVCKDTPLIKDPASFKPNITLSLNKNKSFYGSKPKNDDFTMEC